MTKWKTIESAGRNTLISGGATVVKVDLVLGMVMVTVAMVTWASAVVKVLVIEMTAKMTVVAAQQPVVEQFFC